MCDAYTGVLLQSPSARIQSCTRYVALLLFHCLVLGYNWQGYTRHLRQCSNGGSFRLGGGVHDSYTSQCGLVYYFTSPGTATR